MPNQDTQTQIDSLDKKVKYLERISIQESFDPTTFLYLTKAVVLANALSPTQTYSTSAPSGAAPAGSLWMQDTGSLATNKIFVYTGTVWTQMK